MESSTYALRPSRGVQNYAANFSLSQTQPILGTARAHAQPEGTASMHWARIKEDWSQLTRQAALKWERLTVDDLAYIAGKKSDFICRVHLRYGFTLLDAEEQIERWASGLLLPPVPMPVHSADDDNANAECVGETTSSIRRAS